MWSFPLDHQCQERSPSPTCPSEPQMLGLPGHFQEENLAAWRPPFSVGPLQPEFSRPCLYGFVTDRHATCPVAADDSCWRTEMS